MSLNPHDIVAGIGALGASGIGAACAGAVGLMMPRVRNVWVKTPQVPSSPTVPGIPNNPVVGSSSVSLPPPKLPKGKVKAPKKVPSASDPAVILKAYRHGFREEVKRLRKSSGGKEAIYERPWFLFIGDGGSGKTTIIRELGLYPGILPPMQDETGKHPPYAAATIGSEPIFWNNESAVLVDLPGHISGRADGKPSNGWSLLVNLLRKYRYRRPLDGIVLAIPATEFTGDSKLTSEEIAARATRLQAHLSDVQRLLRMSVPVYVVITKCDEVPGFTSFASHVAPSQRDQIFGWSSPYSLDTAYAPQWIDDAYRSVMGALYPSQLRMLATAKGSNDADGLFIFPGELEGMMGGIHEYTDRLFKISADLHGLTLRGLYFTGDGNVKPEIVENAPTVVLNEFGEIGLAPALGADLLPVVREAQAVQEAAPPSVFFVRDLFYKKIFPEYSIAYPFTGSIVSSNRLILAIQIVMVMIVLAEGIGLGFEYSRLRANSRNAINVLEIVQDDLTKVRGKEYVSPEDYESFAVHVLDGMARLDSNRMLSPAYPSSWFSPMNSDIEHTMVVAFDTIVLGSMDYQFKGKANAIIRDAELVRPSDTLNHGLFTIAQTDEYIRLRSFVDSLQEFDRHVHLYNDFLATGQFADIKQLVRYLFGRDLPNGFVRNLQQYKTGLAAGAAPGFDRNPYRPRASAAARRMLDDLRAKLIPNNEVLVSLRKIEGSLNALAHGLIGFDNVYQMRNVHDGIAATDSTLRNPESAWLSKAQFEPPPPLRDLMQKISVSGFIDDSLAGYFYRGCAADFRGLRQDFETEQSPIIGPMLTHDPTRGTLTVAPRLVELGGAITELLSQKFMATRAAVRLTAANVPGNKVLWNADELTGALGLVTPYREYLAKGTDKFPQELQRAVVVTAGAGLEASMVSLIAQGERIEPVARGFNRLRAEADMALEVKNLKAAATPLNQLLEAFGQGQFVSYQDLTAILRAQSQNILQDAQRLLANEQLYSAGNKLQQWDGIQPLLTALYGVNDPSEMSGYLKTQVEQVQHWALQYAEPVVSFSVNNNLGLSSGTYGLWNQLLHDLQKYDTKTPGNPILTLEDFILGLNDVTPENYVQKLGIKSLSDGTGDFFIDKRNQLYTAVRERCRELVKFKARADYVRLQRAFNQQLAGRYPFSDGDDGGASDGASYEDVKQFFMLYDRHVADYMPVWRDLSSNGRSAKYAVDFLDQLGRVRHFLAPLLDTTSDKQPSLPIDVDFRVNQRKEIGGNQVIEWKLIVGTQEFNSQNALRKGSWHPGDNVTLMLRWALNAPTIPVEPGSKAKLADDGHTIIYNYPDIWSLLRFLRNNAATDQDAARPSDAKPMLLKFTVSTKPNRDAPPEALQTDVNYSQAKLFIRLGILSFDRRDRLRVPAFPWQAPGLDF